MTEYFFDIVCIAFWACPSNGTLPLRSGTRWRVGLFRGSLFAPSSQSQRSAADLLDAFGSSTLHIPHACGLRPLPISLR
jgi:hypothetical protein